MAVSVQVPLQRREMLLGVGGGGSQTCIVAGHCGPGVYLLTVQDINMHHTT